MVIVYGILIFLLGALIGAAGYKALSISATEQKQLNEKVKENEEALSQYKLDVAKHLDDSAKLLEQMNTTCQAAMKQMEESTKLLNKATEDDKPDMPFFDQETQEHLAKSITLQDSNKNKIQEVTNTEPPLDYSNKASGLFDDSKQSVTKS